MILLLHLINSVIFMFINLMVASYTCRRVCKSRSSLEYISSEVSEAMKEIEVDIDKELYVTHGLTKLSSHMNILLKRFNTLEECVIELVRMDHNTESVKIETPANINDEVKKVLNSRKTADQDQTKTPKKRKISTTTLLGAKESILQNPVSKFSTSQPFQPINLKTEPTLPNPVHKFPIPPQIFSANNDTIPEDIPSEDAQEVPCRARTPTLPAVRLLSEQRPSSDDEMPIGFRPTWKCET